MQTVSMHATAPIVSTIVPHVTQTALHILDRQKKIARKRAKTNPTKDVQTRVCAVIASLPKTIKVRDVAKLYGFTASHLSKLRAQAYKGTLTIPEAMRPALEKSFVPRAEETPVDPIRAALLA